MYMYNNWASTKVKVSSIGSGHVYFVTVYHSFFDVLLWHCEDKHVVDTVEPPITDIPNSGQLPHNGQEDMHQLTLLLI